jgi:hypothetical protein
VPKYLKLEITPASSTAIPPNTVGQVTQEVRVTNSQQGEKNILLKLKITYRIGGNPVMRAMIYMLSHVLSRSTYFFSYIFTYFLFTTYRLRNLCR